MRQWGSGAMALPRFRARFRVRTRRLNRQGAKGAKQASWFSLR